jgi:peptide/nickel transport system permease protein
MSAALLQTSRSPFYYVRLRLLQNKPALFGLVVILFCVLITLLGYAIMPDGTPNANDSAAQIKKQSPGFRVQMLKIRKNSPAETVGWLTAWWSGRESDYTLVPITGYRIEGLRLYAQLYGRTGREESYDLVDVVLPLFIGNSPKLPGDWRYEVRGDQVRYLDVHERLYTVSQTDLLARFRRDNLESRCYLLGTDTAGRDMLSRLLFGVRISLAIGLVSVCIALLVGTALGAAAGFFGGRADAFIGWLMTVVWSVPGIMLVIAISMALHSRGLWVTFVAVGLTSWVEISRVVRGQIIGIRQKLYVEAARALGMGNGQIIWRHILPNIIGPVIVIASSNLASAILTEAGLSFLGLGVQPPMPSWGSMINEGFAAIGSENSWHLVLLPSGCISMIVLAFNLLGNGLRDAYDPTTLLKQA